MDRMDVFGVSSIKTGDGFGLVETTRSEQNTYDLKRGDVLFIRSSVKPSGVGLTAVVEADLPKTVYSGFLLRFRDGDALDIGFKRHCFYAKQFRSKLIGASSVSANTNINQDNLRKLLIALPPTEAEQHAIAAALSDVDALLGGLDRLIAKKRDLKQAAMQQLLTGQTRLPGFSGKWEVKTLHEVCQKIQDGTHFSPKLGGNDYLYVTSKNIRFGMLDMSTAERISAAEHLKIYARCDVKKGDLLLTKDGANTGNAALNPMDEPFSLLSSVAMLRFESRNHSAAYFMYQLLSDFGQQHIKDAMSGNAITRLTLKKIRALRFSVAPHAEQTAIAAVLSDMDAELAALEARRDKTRDLKQAIMQELLTGRTRLV
jgi:type I restriction enzyme, S subunit